MDIDTTETGMQVKEILRDKEKSELFLRFVLEEYLFNLQTGKLGIPTMEKLNNAGILHQFLETK